MGTCPVLAPPTNDREAFLELSPSDSPVLAMQAAVRHPNPRAARRRFPHHIISTQPATHPCFAGEKEARVSAHKRADGNVFGGAGARSPLLLDISERGRVFPLGGGSFWGAELVTTGGCSQGYRWPSASVD